MILHIRITPSCPAGTALLPELSTPAAVAVTQSDLIDGHKRFLDVQFTDPAVAGVANVSPASITNGAASTASAGSSQANAETDYQALVSNFLANNPSTEHMVILSTPGNAVALGRALKHPNLGFLGGSVYGIPVVPPAASVRV